MSISRIFTNVRIYLIIYIMISPFGRKWTNWNWKNKAKKKRKQKKSNKQKTQKKITNKQKKTKTKIAQHRKLKRWATSR